MNRPLTTLVLLTSACALSLPTPARAALPSSYSHFVYVNATSNAKTWVPAVDPAYGPAHTDAHSTASPAQQPLPSLTDSQSAAVVTPFTQSFMAGDTPYSWNVSSGASASAGGTATMGYLHASASAAATCSPMSYTGYDSQNNPYTNYNETAAQSTSSADVEFGESLHLQQPGGSYYSGAKVLVTFTIALDSAVSSSPVVPGDFGDFTPHPYGDASLSLTLYRGFNGYAPLAAASVSDSSSAGVLTSPASRVVSASYLIDPSYGDFYVVLDLNVGAQAYADAFNASTGGVADASHTGILQITAPNGLSVIGASGTDYSAITIPEPGSFSLVALAGVPALARGRRRRDGGR